MVYAAVARFDVVVVDEARDLINFEDLAVLDATVTGGLEDGHWAMFMDSNNQRGLVGAFDPNAMALLLSTRPAQLQLVDNCRNTREIVTRTQQLTGADVGVSTAGKGPEVTIERVATRAEGALAAAKHLDRLEEEGISPTDIVLLSPEPLHRSTFAALPARWRNRVDTLDLRRMRRPARSRLGFARTADFKGLESPFILLDHVRHGVTSGRSHLYVGMTRARVGLWIVTGLGSGESDTGLVDG